jgi:hypothetical protein
MKITITQAQLLLLVTFAREAHAAIHAQLSTFIDDPVSVLARWCALLGYEIEISLDPHAHVDELDAGDVDRALQDLGHAPTTPATSSSSSSSGERLTIPQRKLTPAEIAGYENVLQGARWHPGSQLRPGGIGSYHVLLNDGREVVLPVHALELAGAPIPQQEDIPPDETIAAWKAAINGRTGRVVAQVAPRTFTVQFNDGETISLPAMALQFAGCSVP